MKHICPCLTLVSVCSWYFTYIVILLYYVILRVSCVKFCGFFVCVWCLKLKQLKMTISHWMNIFLKRVCLVPDDIRRSSQIRRSLDLLWFTALWQAVTSWGCLRQGERSSHAGGGMGVGSSGLPEADSTESLISQPITQRITWLVYHLNWPKRRPLTKIRGHKCGYDGIVACVGCVSPSHQGSVKQPSVSSLLSDGAGDEILFPKEGTDACESGQNKTCYLLGLTAAFSAFFCARWHQATHFVCSTSDLIMRFLIWYSIWFNILNVWEASQEQAPPLNCF